jgi:TolB-like protein
VHGVGYRFDAEVGQFDFPTAAPQPTADAAASVAPGPLADAPAAEADRDDGHLAAATIIPDSAPAPPASTGIAAAGVRGLLLLAVALSALGLSWWWLRDDASLPAASATLQTAPAARDETLRVSVSGPVLAVLPLRPLGEDGRSADFADGLSEELLNLLARIEGLRVTSRTSSFQFRDTPLALEDIARRLGATHLLEGSVRQDGERLRISLRLVEARGDRALWSETYDREFRDIFAVQDSIARAVGETLQLQLGLASAGSDRDEDPELYRRYLVARRNFEVLSRLTYEGVPAAAEDLRALVREHPDYPRAWGGLATMLWMLSTVPREGRDALRAEAEAAAATALRLDPDQPDAHAVLAGQACREQRWADCLEGSRRAVQRAPSDSLWRAWYAHRLASAGYVQQAVREQQHALELDPLGTGQHQFMGRLLDTLGRHDDALPHLRLAGVPTAHTASYFNALWRRDYGEARRLAEWLDPRVPWKESQLAAVEALQDPARMPQLLAAIDRTERTQRPRDLREPYDFMRFVLPPAQRDYARDISGLDAVQRAGYASYQWLFWMPGERALRQTPAFQRYLRDSGLLAFWRAHGWPDRCRSDGGEGVVCD